MSISIYSRLPAFQYRALIERPPFMMLVYPLAILPTFEQRSLNDTLFLMTDTSETAVLIAGIDEIRVKGSATKRSAIVGGMLTVLVVTPLAILSCGVASFSDEDACGADHIIPPVLVVGAGGALLGTFIGSAIPEWRTRYRSPKQHQDTSVSE